MSGTQHFVLINLVHVWGRGHGSSCMGSCVCSFNDRCMTSSGVAVQGDFRCIELELQ